MQNKSKVHIFLFIIYIIAAFVGILGSVLTAGFGGDKPIYYLSLALFVIGFVLLFISQSKAESGKSTDSFIYGVLAFASCIGAYALNM